MYSMPRCEALNSTGSVTRWNKTAKANRMMPAQVRPVMLSMRPNMSSQNHTLDPKFAMGTSAVRNFIGAYPRAYWTACPHSWQAMAIAEMLLESYTPSDRRTTGPRGSKWSDNEPATRWTGTSCMPLSSSMRRAIWAPVSPVPLEYFEYLRYEELM